MIDTTNINTICIWANGYWCYRMELKKVKREYKISEDCDRITEHDLAAYQIIDKFDKELNYIGYKK